MKKKDFFLIIICAAIFAAGLCIYHFNRPAGEVVTVTVGDEVFGTYPLGVDGEYEIGATNRLMIEGGTARMVWADCPDRHCVKHAPIDKSGGSIICLPNRVSVQVMSRGIDAEVG